eukprot:3164267-Pleurochrysis_carterae.AAC.5
MRSVRRRRVLATRPCLCAQCGCGRWRAVWLDDAGDGGRGPRHPVWPLGALARRQQQAGARRRL